MYVETKQNKTYITPSVYTLSAEETNQPNTELQNLILEGGLTPDANDLTQVKTAIANMIAAAVGSSGADTSLSNITDAGKIVIAHNATISNTYDDITVPASGTELTAPADGYFYAFVIFMSTSAYLEFYDTTVNSTEGTSVRLGGAYLVYQTPSTSVCSFPVYKGQKVTLIYNSNVSFNYTGYSNLGIRFFYDIGSKSEQGV